MRGAPRFEPSLLYAVTVRVAIVAVVVGVFCTWLAHDHVTLTGSRGRTTAGSASVAGSPGLPVGEVDGARLPGRRRRRARERVRDRLDGRRRTRRRRAAASWAPMSPTACSSSSRRARCWQRSPPSARLRFVRDPARARTDMARGRGRTAVAVALLVLVASLRPRLPAGARDHAAAELAAAGETRSTAAERAGGDRGVRRPRRDATARRGARLRLVDRRDDRAAGSRGRTSSRGSSPTSRPRARPCTSSCSAGARARSARDGRPARAEARGGRRGAGHRRRLRLQAVRRRPRRCSPGSPTPVRRSSSTTSSRSTATASTPTTATSTGARTRSAAPTTASST